MSLWTNVDEEVGKPKSIPNSLKPSVVAISEKEAAANGLTAGWNLKTVGTGGRAGRVTYEPLVAMGSITGDNDNITPEIMVTLLNSSATRVVGDPWTVTAIAYINPPQQVYQLGFLWQVSDDNGVTWSTAPGVSNSNEYTTDNPTAGEFLYRCIVSSDKADSEISQVGTIIVAEPQ